VPEVAVKFGTLIFFTDETIAVDTLARELEDRGFESLWVPEHTHIPASRATPYPGGEIPREYVRVLDPYVALTAAAAATSQLRLATGVCLLAQHDPITLAKTVATLDFISRGRVMLGVGLGWNIEEMRNHGVDPGVRRSIVREKVLAMQGLWTHDEFGFEGKYVQFEPSWSWPKPVQRPRLPVHMGGAGGPLGFRHLAEYADGWLPDMTVLTPQRVERKLAEIRQACESIGRDPATVQVSMIAAQPQAAMIEQYAGLGADRCVFLLPSVGADEARRALDQFGEAIERAAFALPAS
jgi:probable F420-dependent oxidoreductase